MSILVWIIFGAIAGWLAHLITGRGGGLIVNIIVGIVGAFIGGFVMSLFGGSGVTGFNLPSLLVAILGAVVLLVVVGLIKR
jgi:uncharacterized membrane protein YeaQ/YmgE (transglycosylase-associated protein family)